MRRITMRGWLLLGLALLLVLVLTIPAVAAGKATPPTDLERVVLVHYPAGKGSGKPAPSEESDRYKLVRAKWDLSNGPIVLELNVAGAPVGGTRGQISAALQTWDDATGADLFGLLGSSVAVGPGLDFTNTISFSSLSEYPHALAVTYYWYQRSTGYFVDADIVFNTDHPWGIDNDPDDGDYLDAYDICNVATHEVGHVVGLADLYGRRDGLLTMYGYSEPGETIKRTLEAGDIAGVQSLYGE